MVKNPPGNAGEAGSILIPGGGTNILRATLRKTNKQKNPVKLMLSVAVESLSRV